MNLSPDVFGVFSVGVAVFSYPPYLLSTFRGESKPHVFSWALWTLLAGFIYFIQDAGGAGPGSWAMGITALCCLFIALAALKHGEKTITRSDVFFFVAALLTIPVWLATKQLTLAAILVTLIDMAAFCPTFRKTWLKPHEELISTPALSAFKHVLSLLALTTWSVPTALAPVALVLLNGLFVAIIVWRRHVLKDR